jgi:ubiquinone/menaquinone biosynthesis C-methylase UbiE
MSFYSKVLRELLSKGILQKDASILVLCGGTNDRDSFYEHGFTNVVISNLDYHWGYKDYAPYEWRMLDAEKVDLPDHYFDWVFVSAGLHHCASPHIALCEMLRVARKGVCALEARDSFLLKIAIKVGLVPEYELEACVISKGKFGGVRYTSTPNFVYRWTEREVKKTVNTFLPAYKHRFNFVYGIEIPIARLEMDKSLLKKIVAKLGAFILPVFHFLFPKQCNHFAFYIEKNVEPQPWMILNQDETLSFNVDYGLSKMNVDACPWK